jgi:hypothetical protein
MSSLSKILTHTYLLLSPPPPCSHIQLFGAKLDVALSIGEKHKRGAAVAGVEAELTKRFCVELPPTAALADKVILILPFSSFLSFSSLPQSLPQSLDPFYYKHLKANIFSSPFFFFLTISSPAPLFSLFLLIISHPTPAPL